MRARWFAVAIGISIASVPASAAAATVLDLPRILELAERNHPNIAVARAKILQARAKLDEAHFAPYSQFQVSGGVALAPTLYGNNVFSPNTDASLTSSLGVAWQAGITGVVPVWTFGKIGNLWEAASANVKVNEASAEKERDDVRVDVRRAFFGLQLSRDALSLVADVEAQLDKGKRHIKAAIDKDEGDILDLAKMETYTAEIEARRSEALRFVDVTLSGLRFYTGVPDLDIPNTGLKAPRHQLGNVTRYLAAAKLYRPEVQMARAGVAARSAQVRLAESQLFPDIGIGMQLGISAAPEIADQINPFVNDPGNYFHFGAALVFQWKLDFLPQVARIHFAEAELEEVRSQQRLALGGVGAEVEAAYAEVLDWQRRVAIYEKAVASAKKWLIIVQQRIDLGTGEDKDLPEPARKYAEYRYSQLSAVMELDMAMAKLAHATGWDAIAPDGK